MTDETTATPSRPTDRPAPRGLATPACALSAFGLVVPLLGPAGAALGAVSLMARRPNRPLAQLAVALGVLGTITSALLTVALVLDARGALPFVAKPGAGLTYRSLTSPGRVGGACHFDWDGRVFAALSLHQAPGAGPSRLAPPTGDDGLPVIETVHTQTDIRVVTLGNADDAGEPLRYAGPPGFDPDEPLAIVCHKFDDPLTGRLVQFLRNPRNQLAGKLDDTDINLDNCSGSAVIRQSDGALVGILVAKGPEGVFVFEPLDLPAALRGPRRPTLLPWPWFQDSAR